MYLMHVWDPHYVGDIMELQWRAARWMLNDYGRFSSVSSVLNQLSWPTFQSCYRLSRLHSYIAQSILSLIVSVNSSILFICNTIYKTISSTSLHLTLFFYDSTPKQLFFKNHKWLEQLPTHLIEITDTDTFKIELQSLL